MNGIIIVSGVSCLSGYLLRTIIMRYLLPAYGFVSPNIHWRYPVFESVMMIGSMVVFLQFPWYDRSLLLALLLTWGCISLSFIDGEYFILPDMIIFPLWGVGLIGNLLDTFTSPTAALFGSFVGYVGLDIVSRLYYRCTSRLGLGKGDIKLFGLLGGWLGVTALPSVLWLASVGGILFGCVRLVMKRDSYYAPMPFGPFLVLGGWLNLLLL